jgi:hypothetical protein
MIATVFQKKIIKFLRRFLLTTSHIWFPRPLVSLSLYLGYLSKFSRWVKNHSYNKRFPRRELLYRYLVESEDLEGPLDYLEFGVAEGTSFKFWVENIKSPDARFVGFDTFEGLPEAWGHCPAGTFNTSGKPPSMDDRRCSFEVGLFQETLPAFLDRWSFERRKVLHLDADLYSSTLFVLTTIAPYLRVGDILIFDDFGSAYSPAHVFRAFEDFCTAFPVSIEALATGRGYRSYAFKVG